MAETNPPAGLGEVKERSKQAIETIKEKEIFEKSRTSVIDSHHTQTLSNPCEYETILFETDSDSDTDSESDENASIPQAYAADALKQLNDFVSCAHKEGNTEFNPVVALTKLRDLAFDGKCRRRELNEEDLRMVGISEGVIPGLDTIITIQENQKKQVVSFTSNLSQNIVFVLKAADLENDEFIRLICSYHRHPRTQNVATSDQYYLLCETLCNDKLRTTVKKFVRSDGEALENKGEILIKYLQKRFMKTDGCKLLRSIRAISLCGDDVKRIVPDEIYELDLDGVRLSTSDATTICNVIRHSSLLHCLRIWVCDLTSKVLQVLAYGLCSSKLKISELDVSLNKNMGADGLGLIGTIVKNNNVDKLRMTGCDLKHKELESFNKYSKGAKISELDVSKNQNMGTNGFSSIGKIIKNNNINVMRMADCKVKHKELESFYKCSNGTKISELDVSWNQNMGADALSSIGKIVKNNAVDKLKMAGCELQHEELESFDKHSKGAKISELDVSWNKSMGAAGLISVGRIVKNKSIDNLIMAGCGLNDEEIDSFNKHSESAKIKQLDLSSLNFLNECTFPLDAVCDLLPNVTESLNLTLRIEEISHLQDKLHHLHPTKLKIQVEPDDIKASLPDLTSERTSKEYWKLPAAENYELQIENYKFKTIMDEYLSISDNEEVCFSSVFQGKTDLEPPQSTEDTYNPEIKVERELGKSTETMAKILQPKSRRKAIGSEGRIPMETVAKKIGNKGDTIEVGGCFIAFPSSTFKEATLVTAKAKIDPNEWPPGRECITPSLDVDAKGMSKKVKVKLTTWCIGENEEDDIAIDVMHFDAERRVWNVIHECSLGDSGFIEFKCRKFSPIIGTLRRILSLSLLYTPAVFRAQREFIIALHLNTKLVKRAFHDDMKESLGEDIRVKRFPVIACKKEYVIECGISCSAPQDEFYFKPSGPFNFTIDGPMTHGNPSFKQCVLFGGQSEMDVMIAINLTKQGKEIEQGGFLHRWKPEYSGSSGSKTSDEKASSPSNKSADGHKDTEFSTASSSGRPVNVNVSVDVHAEDKSSIVGGTVNTGKMEATYTDYDDKVMVMKNEDSL